MSCQELYCQNLLGALFHLSVLFTKDVSPSKFDFTCSSLKYHYSRVLPTQKFFVPFGHTQHELMCLFEILCAQFLPIFYNGEPVFKDIPDLFHGHTILLYYPTVSVHVCACACVCMHTPTHTDTHTHQGCDCSSAKKLRKHTNNFLAHSQAVHFWCILVGSGTGDWLIGTVYHSISMVTAV